MLEVPHSLQSIPVLFATLVMFQSPLMAASRLRVQNRGMATGRGSRLDTGII